MYFNITVGLGSVVLGLEGSALFLMFLIVILTCSTFPCITDNHDVKDTDGSSGNIALCIGFLYFFAGKILVCTFYKTSIVVKIVTV
jgi:hypothetical protein